MLFCIWLQSIEWYARIIRVRIIMEIVTEIKYIVEMRETVIIFKKIIQIIMKIIIILIEM